MNEREPNLRSEWTLEVLEGGRERRHTTDAERFARAIVLGGLLAMVLWAVLVSSVLGLFLLLRWAFG